MTKILITGGKGFIGSHLVDALLKQGYQVITYDKTDRKVNYKGWNKIKHIQGDILDEDLIHKIITKVDYVFHLAGVLGTSETINNVRQAVDLNIIGALNVFNAIKKYKKRGQTITIGGIGWLNPYAITKLAAEKFALMYANEFSVDIKVVRGLNTYGSRQKHQPVRKAVPNFILNALQNKPLEIYGDGKQILDLVYIDDLIKVMLRTMKFKGKIAYVIDAGTGVRVNVNHLAKTIIRLTNSQSKLKYKPMRGGEPIHSITLGKVETLKEIGYIPSTPLEKGLKKTIPWYKEYLTRLKKTC